MSQPSDEPHWWSARRVAHAIASREISALEYLELLLARVERHNPALGAVTTLDDRAFERAEEADEAVQRGEALGPLHGVAMTVKDCLATAGVRTTGGRTELAGYVPRQDAAAVARLRRAGAVVYGKTNLAADSADLQTHNEVFGTGRNPWRPEYTPGGSSGGPAAAVAAGLTPLEVGSDIAGSIRFPAAACGVFGHKPSFGVVAMDGHVPPAPYRLTGLDLAVVGPMARSVEDLRTALGVMVGPHPWDEPAWSVELPPARPVRRVATWFDDPYCPVDDEVRAALELAADRLATTGVVVEPAAPGIRLETSDEVFRRLLASVAVPNYTAEELAEISAGRRAPTGALGSEYVGQTHREYWEATNRRTHLRRIWQKFFTRYDAILLPVAPNVVGRHDHRPFPERDVVVNGVRRPYWDQIVWAGLTGVSYLPSTVVPVRLDARGIPLGVAVAGPYLGDLTTLEVAAALERALAPIGHPVLPEVAP